MLTVLDASIGNYHFEEFDSLGDEYLAAFGKGYIMVIVITFNVLVLNLMIAILSNTYQLFDKKSTGLFLSKILTSRDEMAFDENYGAFLLTMTPVNCIVLPFVPYAIMTKPSVQLNRIIMVLQYSVFIVICYIVFAVGSVCMIPFAYLKCVQTKFGKIGK